MSSEMEMELRGLFEDKLTWILAQEHPYKAAASVFSGRARGSNGGASRRRPPRQTNVDIQERIDDFVAFLGNNYTYDADATIDLETVRNDFDAHRRSNQKQRVSWNGTFHIDALASMDLVLETTTDGKQIRGLR